MRCRKGKGAWLLFFVSFSWPLETGPRTKRTRRARTLGKNPVKLGKTRSKLGKTK